MNTGIKLHWRETAVERMCQDGTLKAYKVRPDSPRSPWRINYEAFVKYCEDIHEKSGLDKRF